MSETTRFTEEQRSFYQSNGYLLVRGLFAPDEAAQLRKEAHELIARLHGKGRHIDATWDSVRQEAEKGAARRTTIHHCHDVQFQSAAFTRLISDPRLMTIAQGIVGPNVQLHHTKLFIKPPENGSPFPMHQDYYYFPHRDNSMIAAIIHFDDAPIEKGCLCVVAGSHKLGPIETSARDHSLPADKYAVETSTALPARAGDVVFFSYLTIHGSGVNRSSEARTTLLVQMRDPTDPPTVATHESRGQGMMLAGIDPAGAREWWGAKEKERG